MEAVSGTRLVWLSPRAIVMVGPSGLIIYHLMDSHRWDVTVCNRRAKGYVAIRQDIADLFAKPCITCWMVPS